MNYYEDIRYSTREEWEKMWFEIPEFPNYMITPTGDIQNVRTQRPLKYTLNQFGVAKVALMKDGRQYNRSLSLLIAQMFLKPPPSPRFDTPIHLDGDRENCDPTNLMWRPRWFAIKYQEQFSENHQRGFTIPIQDEETREVYEDGMHAATTFGLLDIDILLAYENATYTFPTNQRFAPLRL